MRRPSGLTVVKLGGSFALCSRLPEHLDALAALRDIVLVPGGGPFAHAVRAAQAKMGFDDRAAHHMALLAMEQFAQAIASLDDRFSPAASIAAIRGTLRAARVPVWCPARMVLAAAEIPACWEATSDSLAAWLAGVLGARRVVLVKHAHPGGPSGDMEALSAAGVVDPLFPRFLRRSGAEGLVVAPAALRAVAECLTSATIAA